MEHKVKLFLNAHLCQTNDSHTYVCIVLVSDLDVFILILSRLSLKLSSHLTDSQILDAVAPGTK